MSYLQQEFFDKCAVRATRHERLHGVLAMPPGSERQYARPAQVQAELVESQSQRGTLTWADLLPRPLFELLASDEPEQRVEALTELATLAAKQAEDECRRAGRNIL